MAKVRASNRTYINFCIENISTKTKAESDRLGRLGLKYLMRNRFSRGLSWGRLCVHMYCTLTVTVQCQ